MTTATKTQKTELRCKDPYFLPVRFYRIKNTFDSFQRAIQFMDTQRRNQSNQGIRVLNQFLTMIDDSNWLVQTLRSLATGSYEPKNLTYAQARTQVQINRNVNMRNGAYFTQYIGDEDFNDWAEVQKHVETAGEHSIFRLVRFVRYGHHFNDTHSMGDFLEANQAKRPLHPFYAFTNTSTVQYRIMEKQYVDNYARIFRHSNNWYSNLKSQYKNHPNGYLAIEYVGKSCEPTLIY